MTNMVEDDLPYDTSFDEDATIIDLQEGEAVTWPLSSPHRVDNHGFCVSVTTEFSSRESGLKNAAMIANTTLRTKFGHSSSWSHQSRMNRLFKSGVGLILKKVNLVMNPDHIDYVTFRVTPQTNGQIEDITPFERNFQISISIGNAFLGMSIIGSQTIEGSAEARGRP